jgi:hypothetical protein
MTPTRPAWTITLHPDPPGIHSWSVLCGLSMLARSGGIRLRIADCGIGRGQGTWFDARHDASGTRRHIYIDTSDGASDWSEDRARRADAVWKRSPSAPHHRPLGLVAGMRSGCEPLARLAVSATTTALQRRDVWSARAAWSGLVHARQNARLATYAEQGAGEAKVLFQTRAWSDGEMSDPGDRSALNESRAQVIRVLRDQFSDRFVGGFVDSPTARRLYPDLITSMPSDRASYVALIGSCAVAVSTVGLHGSNPWKLAEYLAAGRAIVSEPLRFEIPETLDGVVDWFESPDACVAAVRHLLDDDAARETRRAAAHHFWDLNARPDSLLLRRLAEEFGVQA